MNKLPQQLFNNKLIVKPLPKQDETINGIVIAASVNAKLLEGEVLATCETLKDSNGDVVIKVGEVVLYPEGVGVGQIFNNQECLWIAAHEIWAVV